MAPRTARSALVTGGYGFIGSRVTAGLCSRGWEVTCLVRPGADASRIAGLPVRVAVGDLSAPETLLEAARGRDVCVHMASPSAWDDILDEDAVRTVRDGTATVVAAALEAGCRRFVFVSSAAAVNGSLDARVFDETARFELRGSNLAYACAKHEAERLVLSTPPGRMQSVVVNPVETYGPDDRGWVTAGNIRSIMVERPVVVVAGGTSIAHVDDVADGVVAATERGRPGERYILGGDNVTLRELARLVLQLAGMKARVYVAPAGPLKLALRAMERVGLAPPIPPGLIDYARRYWYVDASKAKAELGFSPRPAEEVLAPTVAWVADQLGRN